MAENAPPASASNAASDASRGMPYYERLRRDLRESLQKKRLVDNNLVRRHGETSTWT
jgi:chromatin modification-related protein EAF6